MDLTLDVGEYKLNIRAAVVITHNGKVLAHRNLNKGHYALIGGRVEIGEDSEKTVKREVMEELGKEIEITGYVSTIEYHEILFIHKGEFVDEDDKKIEHTLKNLEGKDYLQYEWLELDKIEEYPLLPQAAKQVLKEKDLPVHRINNDLN